jgi:hypothetical protein
MVLAGHSDASYLSETNACSRAGGHFFMSNKDRIPNNNGSILTNSRIIKAVMSSAVEAEFGALFVNCREAIPAQNNAWCVHNDKQDKAFKAALCLL